jgi:hypothetical protein
MPSQSIAQIWESCRPVLVAPGASPAESEHARRAFYAGVVAMCDV